MMRIDVLYNEGIISLEDVVKLGREEIRKINMENIDVVKKLIGEEKAEVIKEEINKNSTKTLSEEEKYAMELLENLQKEPIKVYEEDGCVVGHQYNIIAQIGTAKYSDAYVRVSKKEGYLYYGSLWFETEEHGKRSINYEMDSKNNISFNRIIGRAYYREVVELTQKVIGWFEEHMNNAEEIDLDAIDKAIENIFE